MKPMLTKRSDAISAGDMYYNTGKKCKHGHHSDRLTADGSCNECRAAYQRNQRSEIRKMVIKNN